MNRRALALSGLALLVFLSGCTFFGSSGGEIDDSDLLQEADYEWNTSANATFDLTPAPLLSLSSDRYRAVIEVENDTLQIHRERTFRGDTSVEVEALQFRFPNGTVVNATHSNLTAVEESDYTEIRLPSEEGTVAYTARWGGSNWGTYGRSWTIPTFAEGSYEVHLPEGGRTGIPLLSRVAPSPDATAMENNRMILAWEEPDRSRLSVRYYLVRDLYIVGGLAAIGLLVGVVGTAYYYRQIKRAKRVREQIGIDVDEPDDEFGNDGPPPGMR